MVFLYNIGINSQRGLGYGCGSWKGRVKGSGRDEDDPCGTLGNCEQAARDSEALSFSASDHPIFWGLA